MILDVNKLQDSAYQAIISPYLSKGIIVDTCILEEVIDGIVESRLSKKRSIELEKIERFLDLLQFNNKNKDQDKWKRLCITPHILTETCTHLHNNYSKGPHKHNYHKVVEEVMPILELLKETDHKLPKEDILKYIDEKNPVIEIGDISIFLVADTFTKNKEKSCIFSKDGGVNSKYYVSTSVLVLDYENAFNNLL